MTVDQFKIEVLPYKHKLYRFALRILANVQDAEDVVQEVMIRLWTRRDELGGYRSIEAFAMTITKNLSLDRLKKASSRSEELTERNILQATRTPYDEMEMSDSTAKIKALINELPEQQRMVIHLRDIEGYDYGEIARITGLTENTTRVSLSRARKKIREAMINKYSYEFNKD